MPLDIFALAALTDDTEACVDALRKDGASSDDNLLQQMEEAYACLIELQGWRRMFPHIRVSPVFQTAYGVQGVQ
jgi:hypothetical protein